MSKQPLQVVSGLLPGKRDSLFLAPRLARGLVLLLWFALNLQPRAAVRINEIYGAPSDHQLTWTTNGIPRLGSGTSWMEPQFIESGWSSANLPAGYGFGGLATDLTSAMKDKSPSLYLRKEFFLTSTQAAFSDALILAVEYDDGFIAYLNGREVARANCGPTNRFIYASQPAYNPTTNSGATEI